MSRKQFSSEVSHLLFFKTILFACGKWYFCLVSGNALNVTLSKESLEAEHWVLVMTVQGFSTAPLLVFFTIWTRWWVGNCPVHWRTLSSILGFYPLEASSHVPPCCENHKCLQAWPDVPRGVGKKQKSPLGENTLLLQSHCFIVKWHFTTFKDCHNYSWYLYENLSRLKRGKTF